MVIIPCPTPIEINQFVVRLLLVRVTKWTGGGIGNTNNCTFALRVALCFNRMRTRAHFQQCTAQSSHTYSTHHFVAARAFASCVLLLSHPLYI